ncbi:hypothetical protein ERJ70_06990 [Sediminibacillus dalangtanensis]|uniref:Lipoprotein n=1 Tax=Sediminibacillus dalangtanensis TaxID=2729421 RepID=A0ABX7VST6_9BACI|nr:hypothetical protein [Sediminibacillus dalangtanensis]QTM99069.1 hypothetical protein ERJ70_06990 [Sediminibacillus dalangtanensis]
MQGNRSFAKCQDCRVRNEEIIIKKLIARLTIILLLLSACSESEQVIEIEDKGLSSSIFIQKVENNSSSEEMTKMVNDKQKIEDVLTMVDGLKAKKTSSEEMMDKMKSTNTYMFAFSKGEELKTGKAAPYAFYALENGTFIFPYNDFNSTHKPLITIEKHEGLVDELKQLLGIQF